MKYMLLMYANEAEGQKYASQQDPQAFQEAWQSLVKDAAADKVLVSTGGITPGTVATTVRVRDGQTLVTDGPFAETHEQLGGYFLLDCKDLDEALAWAARIPTANYGCVEVRPLWAPS